MKNIVYGMGEMYRAVFTSAQVKILQKFIPDLKPSDVIRYKYSFGQGRKGYAYSNSSLLPLFYSHR